MDISVLAGNMHICKFFDFGLMIIFLPHKCNILIKFYPGFIILASTAHMIMLVHLVDIWNTYESR